VDGNKLTSCGLMFGSYVQIISGANAVTITNNHIDGTANTNFPAVINCLAGGTGLTPGGRNVTAPTDITITGNHINAGGLNGIYLEVILRPAVMNNRIRGAGSFNSGTLVYGGGNGGWGIDIYDGTQATVSGNEISGFAQAFRVHSNTISSGGAGFNISGNNIQSCGYGIALVNTGSGVIGSNMVYQCERPLVTGTGNLAAQPVVVSGNHAFGCTFPMEVGGKVVVRASGAASIGSGVTLAVQALALALPNGTAITFTGGGVLTLTSAASAGATSLVGNLATANVASGATAVVTGLAHSTVSAQNHITLSANGDSVAGTY
jgi:parallel beta-helix repeat protein